MFLADLHYVSSCYDYIGTMLQIRPYSVSAYYAPSLLFNGLVVTKKHTHNYPAITMPWVRCGHAAAAAAAISTPSGGQYRNLKCCLTIYKNVHHTGLNILSLLNTYIF